MKSKELAQRTGFSISSIRFYEREGILPEPERRDNGYRDYDEKYVDLLNLIEILRSLGFPLADIKEFMGKLTRKSIDRAYISAKIKEREANIAKQLALLQDLQQQFRQFDQDKEVIENFLGFTQNLLSSKKRR